MSDSGKHRANIAGLVAALLMLIGVSSCSKPQFYVEFSVQDSGNPVCVLAYYASDKKQGWNVEQASSLLDGKAFVECATVNPTLVWIEISKGSMPPILVYAERGDKISISGTGSNPSTWNAKGNKITEQISQWRIGNQSALKAAISGKTEALNQAVAKFAKANPDNPVSFLLLGVYYDRSSDEVGFRKIYNLLSADAKSGKWQDLLARADFQEVPSGSDKIPQSIVVNTIATGCDTIKSGKAPILFLFTRVRMDNYHPLIKQMRDLRKEYPDSNKRLIAEISLESDSATRWQPLRRDSLSGVVRGWMPLGPSDPTVRALGVGEVPYIIVADSKGKVKYRGTDIDKGIEVYKSTK
ncbi:MAG: hypothetical protein K2M87_07910 [Muribaculaceae bacterium]|nr:hypothetical protein [Muribaculaceae bacterium]